MSGLRTTDQRTGRRVRAAALACLLGAAVSPAVEGRTTAGGGPVPSGFSVSRERTLAPGVTRMRLTGSQPRQVAHVARVVPDARASLHLLLSRDRVTGPNPLERTTSMCRRVRCDVAVNGDFFGRDGTPVGGLVIDGEPVRSARNAGEHLLIGPDGFPSLGRLVLGGRFLTSHRSPVQAAGLELPLDAPAEVRSLAIDGINVPRPADTVVAYTSRFGPSTRTNRFGVELTLDVLEPTGPVRLGVPTRVHVTGASLRRGDATIPRGGLVLSGHGEGARALLELWEAMREGQASTEATILLDADRPLVAAVGGRPVLVRGGRSVVGAARARGPRTAVGWTRSGDLLLVTADGRQPRWSVGMSLPEVADLLRRLGAVDALALDGGGSTTFVTRGTLTNRPSDRLVRRAGRNLVVVAPRPGDSVRGTVERRVAVALAVVPDG